VTNTKSSDDTVQLYRRLLKYAWPYRWMLVLAVIAMAFLAASSASFTALVKPLVDDGFVGRDPDIIRWTPLAIIGLFLIRGAAYIVSEYATAWVGRRVTYDLRNAIFGRMVRLPAGYHDLHPSSGLVSKLVYDVEQIAAGVTGAVYTVVGDGLTVIALFAWLLYLDWKLTLLFATILPLTTLIVRAMSRRFRRTSHNIQEAVGEITQVTQEAAEGNRVVKAFGAEEAESRAFEVANERNRRQTLRRVATAAIGVTLLKLIAVCAFAAVIYFALAGGSITAGGFTSYISSVMLMGQPTRRLAKINETVQTALAAASSIFRVLDEPPEEDSGTVECGRVSGRIEYRNVRFQYAGTAIEALQEVSFSVAPGQTVALVGASGSGKTTCVSLLPRFYRASHGEIALDGVAINDYRLASLRAQIALVGQEAMLFDDTIRGNIVYGAGNPVDEARLMDAARAAHVLEFAERLPEGLDTRVGERGARLSGGQRQRVAIARALYKNAPILILDEATSALDTESERLVQDAMRSLMRNRTTLVIAHRLSTVEHADRILVFSRGRIVESGTHAELLAHDGIYAGLYRNQFREAAA
jgi:subfamily B ATP-binding cassette protein MsbA